MSENDVPNHITDALNASQAEAQETGQAQPRAVRVPPNPLHDPNRSCWIPDLEDIFYDPVSDKYWCLHNLSSYGPVGVSSLIPIEFWPLRTKANGDEVPYPPAKWARETRAQVIDGTIWWPGKPALVRDLAVQNGEEVALPNALVINRYENKTIEPTDKPTEEPRLWLEHLAVLFPVKAERDHFVDYLAHTIQHPGIKINHGIVISGAQGIGKDMMLAPIRRFLGGNCKERQPDNIMGRFNDYAKSVLLVINEIRSHGTAQFKAVDFYNKTKELLAGASDFIPVEEKNQPVFHCRNVCRVIMTTNEPETMHVPEDDRRLFMLHSETKTQRNGGPLSTEYFNRLGGWLYDQGGINVVTRWLSEKDIAHFQPYAPAPMTAIKEAITHANKEVRRSELEDVIDSYKESEHYDGVIFESDLKRHITDSGKFFDVSEDLLRQLRSGRRVHILRECGFVAVKPPEEKLKWASSGFRSRTAYIDVAAPEQERVELIYAAVKRRADILAGREPDKSNVIAFKSGPVGPE